VTIVLEAVVVEEGEAWLESAALVTNTSLTLWGCLGLNFGGEKECTERKQQPLLLLLLLLQNLPNWTSYLKMAVLVVAVAAGDDIIAVIGY